MSPVNRRVFSERFTGIEAIPSGMVFLGRNSRSFRGVFGEASKRVTGRVVHDAKQAEAFASAFRNRFTSSSLRNSPRCEGSTETVP